MEIDFLIDIDKKLKNNKEQYIPVLIEKFKMYKYKNPYIAIVILFILNEHIDNKEEINFHLFNHYLMIRLFEEALSLLDTIFDNRMFFIDSVRYYKLQCENGEYLEQCIINEQKHKAYEFLNQLKSKIENSKHYFKLSEYMILYDLNKGYELFENSIKHIDIAKRNMLILKFAKTIEKFFGKNKSIAFMEHFVKNNAIADIIPIIYRLAVYYEDKNRDMALEFFNMILKEQEDYLDTIDRYNYLTKYEKQCKIKKYEKDNIDIHFS